VSLAAGALGCVVGFLAGSPPLAVLLLLVGVAGPYALVVRSVSRRRAKFDDQLPDILDLLAASLQSGAGISAALELVVAEAAEPAAGEFGRVLNATRVGESLVDALQTMADRLDSRDLVYTVQAIAVQQRTGGKLAEVLSVVAEFMRSRFELKRELRALTAEGRLSAIILGGLPFAIGGVISLTSPEYLRPLYTTGIGAVMLIGAGVLMLGAFVAMARIVRIEV
jgi:tight adherence protein B